MVRCRIHLPILNSETEFPVVVEVQLYFKLSFRFRYADLCGLHIHNITISKIWEDIGELVGQYCQL